MIMTSSKLQYTIQAQSWQARAGVISLNGVEVKTPVFMPVWTKATIKGLFLDMIRNPDYLWELETMNLMLANTFHLYLRPWEDLVYQAWWVQKMMNWPGLVLTDSGGFQVFSLWLNKSWTGAMNKKWPMVSIKEDGIKFKSPIDGSTHFMSPESCVDIQSKLWSDIMMMLDVCSPGWSDDRTYKKHMDMTHRWAKRQFEYYNQKSQDIRWVLFPIVQWWTNFDLRQESLDFLTPFAIDGIAVGWVSVGESREQVQSITKFCGERLPTHVPRYLMGIGDWETIRYAILSWFDMFDCVMPTRLGRHGMAYTNDGYVHLSNTRFRNDHTPLWAEAKNNLSTAYTKAYIHHLLREKEALWGSILSLHNIFFLHEKVSDLREDIIHGRV